MNSNIEKILKVTNDVDIQLLEDFKNCEEELWIDTGSLILNAHISGSIFKGISGNGITTFSGDPKAGKSFLTVNATINAIFDDYIVYFQETEGSPIKERIVQHVWNGNHNKLLDWSVELLKNPKSYKFFNDSPEYIKGDKINTQFFIDELKEILKMEDRLRDIPKMNVLASLVRKLNADNGINHANAMNVLKYDFIFYKLRKAIIVTQPETVEDVIENANTILNVFVKERRAVLAKKDGVWKSPRILFILDSNTGLNTRKQYADAQDKDLKSDMGTFAKQNKVLFNMVSVRCDKLGIGWLNTAHVYEKDMGNNIRKKTATGGNASYYLSGVMTLLTRKMDKDKETKAVKGVEVKSTILESRFSKHQSVEFYIPYHKPMNRYYGLKLYFTWSICGIDKGRLDDFTDLHFELTQKQNQALTKDGAKAKFTFDDFKKILSKAKSEALDGHIEVMIDNGWMKDNGDNTYSFTENLLKLKAKSPDKLVNDKNGKKLRSPVLNPNSPKWIVKHLGEVLEENELYNSRVLNMEVLKQIDEVIKVEFKFDTNVDEELELILNSKNNLDEYSTV